MNAAVKSSALSRAMALADIDLDLIEPAPAPEPIIATATLKPIPEVGVRFKAWEVTGLPEKNTQGLTVVPVACDCGNTGLIRPYILRVGLSSSCKSCYSRRRNMKHGFSVNNLEKSKIALEENRATVESVIVGGVRFLYSINGFDFRGAIESLRLVGLTQRVIAKRASCSESTIGSWKKGVLPSRREVSDKMVVLSVQVLGAETMSHYGVSVA